jgi:hypothetical protein
MAYIAAAAAAAAVHLQVGRDEDGKLGPGWFDATDSEMFPMNERLRTQVAVEALQVRGAWLLLFFLFCLQLSAVFGLVMKSGGPGVLQLLAKFVWCII